MIRRTSSGPWLGALTVLGTLLAGAGAPASAGCGAHEIAVLPPTPTTVDPIILRLSGECPLGGEPGIPSWSRDGSRLRIDAISVLPGVPDQPIVVYERLVEIGPLPAGRYRAEYFLRFLAAPGAPAAAPAAAPPPAFPVATLEFEVAAAIPSLSDGALALLAAVLALAGLRMLRGP